MRPTRSLFPKTSAAEAGFSLIEVMITVALLAVVVGALLTIFESVQRSAAFVQNRSETLDSMRLVVDQMTKEIRQASSVSATSTASTITMNTYVLGVPKTIVYEASGSSLTRSVDGGPAVVLQTRLTSTSIFTYTDSVTNVQLVGLTLTVHPLHRPNTNLVLTSEARLRNRNAL
jgi:prepilin-type N-terminal cleavage/methylation domain-containing protein